MRFKNSEDLAQFFQRIKAYPWFPICKINNPDNIKIYVDELNSYLLRHNPGLRHTLLNIYFVYATYSNIYFDLFSEENRIVLNYDQLCQIFRKNKFNRKPLKLSEIERRFWQCPFCLQNFSCPDKPPFIKKKDENRKVYFEMDKLFNWMRQFSFESYQELFRHIVEKHPEKLKDHIICYTEIIPKEDFQATIGKKSYREYLISILNKLFGREFEIRKFNFENFLQINHLQEVLFL